MEQEQIYKLIAEIWERGLTEGMILDGSFPSEADKRVKLNLIFGTASLKPILRKYDLLFEEFQKYLKKLTTKK